MLLYSLLQRTNSSRCCESALSLWYPYYSQHIYKEKAPSLDGIFTALQNPNIKKKKKYSPCRKEKKKSNVFNPPQKEAADELLGALGRRLFRAVGLPREKAATAGEEAWKLVLLHAAKAAQERAFDHHVTSLLHVAKCSLAAPRRQVGVKQGAARSQLIAGLAFLRERKQHVQSSRWLMLGQSGSLGLGIFNSEIFLFRATRKSGLLYRVKIIHG